MAYETYTTKALVCGTFDRNTADRSFLLFTREAGMLYADARSVREERSRQRYALQDFSLLRVSLVKGKRGWRVGSIEPLRNFYHEAIDKAARGSVVHICRLLRRFVKGEETQTRLFDYAIEALEVLQTDPSKRSFVELVISLEILGFLGYVDAAQLPLELQALAPSAIALHQTEKLHKRLQRLYTHAVSVSHL